MIDDACLKIVTYDQNGNKAGENTICATYSQEDGAVDLDPGSEFTLKIVHERAYETEVSIDLNVHGISLPGILKTNIQSGTNEKVTYTFRSPSDKNVRWSIDFLGPYNSNNDIYPIIWAFYTTDPPTPLVSKNKDAQMLEKYYVHTLFVNLHGEVLREEVVELKKPLVKSIIKRVKLVKINVGDEVYVLIPEINDATKVKKAILKIWEFKAYNGKAKIKLPLNKAPDLVLDALKTRLIMIKNPEKAIIVTLDVEYVDNSSDGYLYIAVGRDVLVSK